MNKRGVRSVLGLTLVGVLGLTSMTCPTFASGAQTALILGGTGGPTPGQRYVDATEKLYLVPKGYGSYTPKVVTTPEEAYPITGVDSMFVDDSVAHGVNDLDTAIKEQFAAGNNVVVFGYSQGAAVASQEMAQLAASSNPPRSDQLSLVLVGNPSNPNGGLNQRFPGVFLPSLGTTFNYTPTASNTYPIAVYTQEYDGFANFPQYPLNLLADLNAFLGIFTQHFGYLDLTPEQINSAIALPTTGNTTTQYYMIPTENLPLLVPVRLIPVIGNPLADLLEPDLRILVNLGYGNIENGWSPGPADVPTPFGLFPTGIDRAELFAALAAGAKQGIADARGDLKELTWFDKSSLSLFLSGMYTVGWSASPDPSLLQGLAGLATLGNAGVPVTPAGGPAKTLAGVIAGDIAVVKPLADTARAIGLALPKYNKQLFTSQLAAGHPAKAIGLPIAADLALVPYVLIVGAVFPVVGAVATTATQLAQLVGVNPNPEPAVTVDAESAVITHATAAANANPAPPTRSQHGQSWRKWASRAEIAGDAGPQSRTPVSLKTALSNSRAHTLAVTTLNRVKALGSQQRKHTLGDIGARKAPKGFGVKGIRGTTDRAAASEQDHSQP